MHCWRTSSARQKTKCFGNWVAPKGTESAEISPQCPNNLFNFQSKGQNEQDVNSPNKIITFPGEFPQLDSLESCCFLCSVILIWAVCTLCTTALTSTLQIPSPKLLYLDVGDNFKGDSCKIEGVHCKIHQIPPVMYVLIEATIPHFLDFSPDETCGKRGSSLPWQGVICH